MDLSSLLVKAINSSIKGGDAIMNIYKSDFTVEHKSDNSPLTLADKNCHSEIIQGLESTKLPVLSEEGIHTSYEERKKWKYFWLVDPLDGTKEFVKRNGEFTVNIALIYNQIPILGVVYVPVKQELYFANKDIGSYKIKINNSIDDLNQIINKAKKLPIDYKRNNCVIVGSRSHMTEETKLFFDEMEKQYGSVEILSIGSSLKLCMVAEGKADLYPRYAPTMEWDTGAGHAIVRYAGFSVNQYNSDAEVIYNKKNLLNPWFLVKKP
jgi:3'(2'), 5'-bisphosphate nucleotidase